MAKLLFLDLETSGTDKNRHGIIQIAGIIEIDGEEKERFNFDVSLFPGDIVNKEALEINKKTIEEISLYPRPLEVYKAFLGIVDRFVSRFDKNDKFYLVGYNSRFDDDFLREWFLKFQYKFYGSYFFWPSIDVANMAALHFMEDRKNLKDFKLMTVAQKAGVDISGGVAHDAAYDVGITRELFYKLRG